MNKENLSVKSLFEKVHERVMPRRINADIKKGYFNEVSPKYFINDKNRTVTCVIDVCDTDAAHWFRVNNKKFGYIDGKKYRNSTRYVGIATCSPDDEFNKDIGKDIAFERAYKKYIGEQKSIHKAIIRSITNSLEEYAKQLDKKKKYNREGKVEDIINRYYNKD